MTTPQRLPIVNSDDGVWGDILRQYIKKEHYDDGTDNAVNGGHQFITIRAGVATSGGAPIKFTSGTLLTAAETGAMEFVGDHLYITDTSGPTRRKIAAYDNTGGATGDIYYRNSSGYFTSLGIGGTGNFLTVSSGIPAWTASIPNTSTITVKDANLTIQDDGDTTKQAKFQLSGLTTGHTTTLAVPEVNGTTEIVGKDIAQTLTNKTIDFSANTITNLPTKMLELWSNFTDDSTGMPSTSDSGATWTLSQTRAGAVPVIAATQDTSTDKVPGNRFTNGDTGTGSSANYMTASLAADATYVEFDYDFAAGSTNGQYIIVAFWGSSPPSGTLGTLPDSPMYLKFTATGFQQGYVSAGTITMVGGTHTYTASGVQQHIEIALKTKVSSGSLYVNPIVRGPDGTVIDGGVNGAGPTVSTGNRTYVSIGVGYTAVNTDNYGEVQRFGATSTPIGTSAAEMVKARALLNDLALNSSNLTSLTNRAIAGASLVIDPAFEDTTVYRETYNDSGNSGVWSYSTDYAHGGTNSMKVVASAGAGSSGTYLYMMPHTKYGGNTADNSTGIRVQPGQQFYIEIWVYNKVGNVAGGSFDFYLWAKNSQTSSGAFATGSLTSQSFPTAGTWTKYSTIITIQSGYDLMWPIVDIITTSTQNGNSYYFDDVRVTDISDLATTAVTMSNKTLNSTTVSNSTVSNSTVSNSTIDNTNQVYANTSNFVLEDGNSAGKQLYIDLSGLTTSGGSVTYDATGAGKVAANITTNTTWSHTINSSANAIVVAVEIWATSSSGPSNLTAKVGTTSMTQLGSVTNYASGGGNWGSVVLFGLTSPPTGSQTITVTIGGGITITNFTGNSVSYYNVASFGSVSTNTGTSSTATQSVSSASGERVLQAVGGYNSNISSYNQSTRYKQDFVNFQNLSLLVGDAGGAGTVNFSAGLSASVTWGSVAVRLTGGTVRTLTIPDASTTLVGTNTTQALTNKDLTGAGNTFPTFNQNTTGSAAKWTTARNLAGNSVDGSANVAFANKFVVQGTSDAGLSGAQFLGALSSGLVKNTTTTGVLSIASAGTDYTSPSSTDTFSGAKTFNDGKLILAGSSSGTTTLGASATASGTVTLPAATDTLVGKATTDILTNKTYDTAGTGNVFKINGTQVSAVTGTGSVVLATSPALTTPNLGTPSALTLTNATGLPLTGIVSTAYNSTPGASKLAQWDANSNLSANNTFDGYATTVTSATPVTLTISSAQIQVFTGSTAQTVSLPTTSVPAGAQWRVINNSTAAVTVNASGGTTINVLAANTSGLFTATVATPTLNTQWDGQYWGSIVASGKTLTVNNTLTFAGTDGTSLTFPANATPAASTLAQWDSSSNLSADTFISTRTTTATSASAYVMDITFTQVQVFTGSTAQTVKLPTTSIIAGQSYTIINQSTADVTVQSSAANTINIIKGGGSVVYAAKQDTPTSDLHWYSAAITGSRTNTTASSATPAINVNTTDVFAITALVANITSMTSGLTGTPVDGQTLIIRIKGAASQTITWGASFVASGTVSLLAATVAGKTHNIGFVYDAVAAAWVCLAADPVGY